MTRRGRLADGALFAFAVGFGGLTFGYLWHTHGLVIDAVDLAAGLIACLALWWRRRRPMAVVIVAAAGAFSPLALGAVLVALCTAAALIRGRALIPVVLLAVAGSLVWPVVNPAAGEVVTVAFPGFLAGVIAFGWGLYLRTRRELVASLHERAERLEADRQHSAGRAREAERRRIAREMHDVLAHRLSLLSVHAGALEFHPDASPGEIAQAGAVIRESAAAALGELRQVITVLREDRGPVAGPPLPGLGQLPDLLAESRSAGMALTASIDLPGAGELPEAVGRTVYRVVQEGLTNARKHAPGAPVTVTLTAAGQAVTAELISRGAAALTGVRRPAPGAGVGLIGLAERVELAGGRVEHGLNAMGDFVLRATIPEKP
jgi:signal transduction histidine kinase